MFNMELAIAIAMRQCREAVRVESNQGLASCLLKMFDRYKDEIRYRSL